MNSQEAVFNFYSEHEVASSVSQASSSATVGAISASIKDRQSTDSASASSSNNAGAYAPEVRT